MTVLFNRADHITIASDKAEEFKACYQKEFFSFQDRFMSFGLETFRKL